MDKLLNLSFCAMWLTLHAINLGNFMKICGNDQILLILFILSSQAAGDDSGQIKLLPSLALQRSRDSGFSALEALIRDP